MKLGRLLLKGLKRRHPKPAPAQIKASRRKSTVGAPPDSTQLVPSSAPTTQASQQQQQQRTEFLANSLIRPNDALKRSMEAFLLDQRSIHTRRAYGKDLKRFMAFILHRNLERGSEAINRLFVIGYKEFLLKEGLEHTTIDRHLATLRSFFRWLVDDGVMDRNPAEGVRFLNPKRVSRTNGFTDDEVRRILACPDMHTRTGAQHYAILMVLFYCGLRRSEICDLRTSQIGAERGHQVLRLRGKGNSERILVMTVPVWNAVLYYFKMTGKRPGEDQFLFSPIRNNRTGIKEKSLDPSHIFYIVTKYARAAGIANRVSPHSCRATAISNARDHKVPDRAIQEFAGWASPDMITRYDKRKSAIEKSASHSIEYGAIDRVDLPEIKVDEVVSQEIDHD